MTWKLWKGEDEMKTKEMIEYLQQFDQETEIIVIAANIKQWKKYSGKMFVITDAGRPFACIEISGESDFNIAEIAEKIQDERKREQK